MVYCISATFVSIVVRRLNCKIGLENEKKTVSGYAYSGVLFIDEYNQANEKSISGWNVANSSESENLNSQEQIVQ